MQVALSHLLVEHMQRQRDFNLCAEQQMGTFYTRRSAAQPWERAKRGAQANKSAKVSMQRGIFAPEPL